MRVVVDDSRGEEGAEAPSILSKAFELLRGFSATSRVMTLSELTRASGLPKSTVHRLIARLIDLGAMEQHRSGYVISSELLQIAATAPAFGMRDLALPFLADLHRWSGLSVQLGMLRQFDVVLLEKLVSRNAHAPTLSIGERLPANCSAMGKVLLAWENLEDLESFLPRPMLRRTRHSTADVDTLMIELRKTRGAGIAFDNEEAQIALSSTAVPILIRDHAVGALAVSYSSTTELGSKVEHALRQTAAHIAHTCFTNLVQGKQRYAPYDF